MNFSKQSSLVLGILLCVAIGIMASVSRGKNPETQDPATLDRRISLLEQRLYTIESNINRLQQYVTTQRPSVTPPSSSTSDRDIILLREDVQKLSIRLAEVECGVLHLDERTTPPSRRSSTRPTELCRQNADAPLRLSARP